MTILATETQDMIPALCSRFTEATGWPLQFTPTEADNRERIEAELRQSPELCWIAEIEDGARPIGFLHLSYPEGSGDSRNLVPVCEMAGYIAQLLTRISTAVRHLESRTRELSTLVDVGLTARNPENLPDALSHLLGAAVQLTGYRSAAFFLLNPATNCLRLRAIYHFDADKLPPSPRELASSHPDVEALLKGPVSIHRQSAADDHWLPPEASSALCVAVQSAAVPIGTLWVYDRRAHVLVDQEAQLLKSIAAQIATILERVVLLRESETQHRLSCELRVASESHGVFPATVSENAGLEVAARCVSRHELGGDLCELFPLGDRQTSIALGDASGNSIPAALVMTAVRGGLRALPRSLESTDVHPAHIMERLNDALHDITGPSQFMSLFYGVYDAETRQLTYTNAGHPAPILIRGNETLPLESHGMLLGVIRDVSYEYSVLDLLPGDLLVIFSDGISEAMSRSHDLFRSEGIIAAIRSTPSRTAQDVLETIWRKAELHAEGSNELDDRTLLVIRVADSPLVQTTELHAKA